MTTYSFNQSAAEITADVLRRFRAAGLDPVCGADGVRDGLCVRCGYRVDPESDVTCPPGFLDAVLGERRS